MRILLDTHTLLWWLDGDKRLPPRVRRMIQASQLDVLVSAVSAWEITTKARLGKLPKARDVAADVPACVHGQGFVGLPISLDHAQAAGQLPEIHRDPFDRLLAAQAQIERLAIVSTDEIFDRYGVRRLW